MWKSLGEGAHENMPSQYVSVYIVGLAMGPVDKSSHIKLMDEIPPKGGILANFPAHTHTHTHTHTLTCTTALYIQSTCTRTLYIVHVCDVTFSCYYSVRCGSYSAPSLGLGAELWYPLRVTQHTANMYSPCLCRWVEGLWRICMDSIPDAFCVRIRTHVTCHIRTHCKHTLSHLHAHSSLLSIRGHWGHEGSSSSLSTSALGPLPWACRYSINQGNVGWVLRLWVVDFKTVTVPDLEVVAAQPSTYSLMQVHAGSKIIYFPV